MKLNKILYGAMMILVIYSLWCPVQVKADETLSLKSGWNLLGSKFTMTISNSPFSDPEKITSIWKWAKGSDSETWAVYIPGPDGGAAYASAKGFQHLQGLEAGEGFWVNSKKDQILTIQGNPVIVAKFSLGSGWNLKGLSTDKAVDVPSLFKDGDKFTSIWSWDTSGDQATWAVYLVNQDTQSYASQKGFKVLDKIEPGQGFWVNVKAGGTTELQLVETPPLVGKVSEFIPSGDKGTYKPVSNATVYVEGNEVGKTDSQGKFQVDNFIGSTAKIKVKADGYIQFDETINVPNTKQVYIFLQKQDPFKNTLSEEATASTPLEKFSNALSKQGAFLKPVPKTLKAKDDEAIITVSNMKLSQDITVYLTPYKGLNVIPGLEEIAKLDLGGEAIPVAGASIDMVDSKGDPITNEKAGFQGKVTVKSKKILGKFSLNEISEKINNKEAKLLLLAKGKDGWYQVPGEGSVKNNYIECFEGTYLTKLHPFLFVLVQEKANKVTIAGQVKDKESETGIPGAFVFLDGYPESAITDEQGQFSIKITLGDQDESQYLTISALVDGFYGETKNIPKSSLSKPVTFLLKPFGDVLTINGKVKDKTNSNPLEGAKVVLKAPSVLDQIRSTQDGIVVGKDETALYEWKIYDSSYETVLKTFKAKGKNVLQLNEISNLVTIKNDEYGLLLIELEVKFGQNTSETYSETGFGFAIFIKQGDTVTGTIDLLPSYSTAPYYEVWTDKTGSFSFYMIPKSMLSLLKISASKEGYYSSKFEAISGSTNVISKEILLESKPTAIPVEEDFETGGAGWNQKVLADGIEIADSNVKWQIIDKPDTLKVDNKVMEYLSSGIAEWVDVEGTVGDITLNNELSSNLYKVYDTILSYTTEAGPKLLTLNLYDLNDKIPGYNYIIPADGTDTSIYVWWDYEKYPLTEYETYPVVKGSKVMVSYKKTKKTTPVYLPPAFSGNRVFWFGNLAEQLFKGTYYDSAYSKKKVEGILTSPVYDLAYFDTPTLTLYTWLEISSTKPASLLLEVAIVDDNLKDGETVELDTIKGVIKLKKGEFVPLGQINPMLLYGMDFTLLFGPDKDGDGIPDKFEVGKDLNPDEDLDQDGLTNLAEWVAGMIPGAASIGGGKEILLPPIGTSFLPDDPTLLEWMPLEYNLEPFRGHKIQLRFRYIYQNLPGSLYRGWAIDKLSIKDEKSYYAFQLLTQEFGYGNVVDLPEPVKPASWGGAYDLSIGNLIVTDLDSQETKAEQGYETATQLIQDGSFVQFDFVFKGVKLIVDGHFDNYYKELSLTIYDEKTGGMQLYGSGSLKEVDKNGTKGGDFYLIDVINYKVYEGTMTLLTK